VDAFGIPDIGELAKRLLKTTEVERDITYANGSLKYACCSPEFVAVFLAVTY